MKIIVPLFMACFVFIHPSMAQRSVPDQVKKGKWMIGHDAFTIGYEKGEKEKYNQNGYLGKEEYSGFHTRLLFQSPNWGAISAISSTQKNYDANGTEVNGNTGDYMSFAFRPFAGRFISDGLLVGAELNLFFAREKTVYTYQNDTEENISRYTTLGIGPHIRYYFGALKSKQLFHAGLSGGVNYAIVNSESSDNGGTPDKYKTKEPGYYAKPYLGSSWFAGKRWTFGVSVSYLIESSRYTVSSDGNTSSKTNSSYDDLSLDGSVSFTF